jgi:inner membrane transporter RhtA
MGITDTSALPVNVPAVAIAREHVGSAPGPAAGSGRATAVGLMLASALSNQAGAATGTLAFPVLGPAGVVAVRQWVAALVLVAVGRPRLRAFTRREWLPVLGLAAVFAAMNLTLYTSISRVGLGLAVTLEFLGPLTVALAASRRRLDLACALAAGGAVLVLMRPQPTSDYVGIGLGLIAAVCWACYILLNRVVGARLPGAQGSAAAALVSGALYVPLGIVVMLHHAITLRALGCAVAAGLGSSAVPFLVDLFALRRVPARFFGVFMSVNPVLAALVGWIVLGQALGPVSWIAIAVIVAANTASVVTAPATSRARTRSQPPDSGSD